MMVPTDIFMHLTLHQAHRLLSNGESLSTVMFGVGLRLKNQWHMWLPWQGLFTLSMLATVSLADYSIKTLPHASYGCLKMATPLRAHFILPVAIFILGTLLVMSIN